MYLYSFMAIRKIIIIKALFLLVLLNVSVLWIASNVLSDEFKLPPAQNNNATENSKSRINIFIIYILPQLRVFCQVHILSCFLCL